jgi:hypothetical protein
MPKPVGDLVAIGLTFPEASNFREASLGSLPLVTTLQRRYQVLV